MTGQLKQGLVAVLAGVATFGVLRWGQSVYRSRVVQVPLVSQLDHLTGVRRAAVSPVGSTTLWLTSQANLKRVYQQAMQKVANSARRQAPAVTVVNQPSSSLARLANDVRFIIAQGEVTGQYVAMKNAIQSLARRSSATASVQLGAHHLYVTLRERQAVDYLIVPANWTVPGHD
jgi:hypothetical protein